MERAILEIGASGSVSRIVTAADLASALSADPREQFPDVFATSRMIALMELAAAQVMRSLQAEGELSVGVTVEVTHSAATPVGETVRANAEFAPRAFETAPLKDRHETIIELLYSSISARERRVTNLAPDSLIETSQLAIQPNISKLMAAANFRTRASRADASEGL